MKSDSPAPLHIVAVGLHGLRYLFEALAPEYRRQVQITLLERAYDDAVMAIEALSEKTTIDAVVAAGSSGHYVRQRLSLPVVLVKVSGFDVMQGVVLARQVSERMAVVMYGEVASELADFVNAFDFAIELCAYDTESQARACVQQLKKKGVDVVVAPGLVVDLARAAGMQGILLYSQRLVREALEDAVELGRRNRLEVARRERVDTILGHLRDAVLAVDLEERIDVVNPAMATLLGQPAEQLVGRRLSELNPALGLRAVLQTQRVESEQIQLVGDKTVITTRLPIHEQGKLTGAVLIGQDSVAIQRLDRNLRSSRGAKVRFTRYRIENLVGQTTQISYVRRLARAYARQRSNVLILGETGTGKEVLAQGIHSASERSQQPFIAVNCAAFPESLLESELFGYVEGAFTGASRGGKMGVFEAAHTGTIFLDEIGEMPLALQSRLLRVLQEREVTRVGAVTATPIDVRVIAATHRDLPAEVALGRFRQDLFYRLNTLVMSLPPLRERVEDLPELIKVLAESMSSRLGASGLGADDLAKVLPGIMAGYPWPGNVRELENLIERLMVMAQVMPEQSVQSLVSDAVGNLHRPADVLTAKPLKALTRQAEAQKVLEAMAQYQGNHQAVAKALGISRTTLWRRLKSMGQ